VVRLPPLNALRAFEASARHGSFVGAAEELHVTQGAISRHVKLLEEHLKVPLFRRLPRGLELTPAAHKLLPKISASFDLIVQATQDLAASTHELKIIAANTLANRWLIPRLADFKKLHPDLQISVGIFRSRYEEFYRGNYDVGIVCSETDRKRPPDLEAILIRRERLTPVCAPAVLNGEAPLREPLDLKDHTLIHPDPDIYDWRKWLDQAGLSHAIDCRQGQTYETMEMAVRAAVQGLGVAIADLHLIREELASGALVAPFDVVVSDNTGYFLVCQRGRLAEPNIATLRDWLIAEAKRDEQDMLSEHPAKQLAPSVAGV
jgi:DNA-binding transcriptional LysR family regulator